MSEQIQKWLDKIVMTLIGLIPFVALAAILTYYDVQNLKKLMPLQQQVAVLESRMNECERQNAAQWRKISR